MQMIYFYIIVEKKIQKTYIYKGCLILNKSANISRIDQVVILSNNLTCTKYVI